MNEIKQIPFLRIAFPFILGIAANLFFSLPVIYFKYFIAGSFLLLVFSYVKYFRESYGKQWFFGAVSQSLFFFIGAWLAGYNLGNTGVEKNYGNSNFTFVAKLAEPASEKDKTIRTFLDFEYVNENGKLKSVDGKVLAYFQKDSIAMNLEPGDLIVLTGTIQELQKPKNPNEFDYKKYLSYHKVSQQIYVGAGKWKLLGKNQSNILFNYAFKIQQYLINTFKKGGLEGDEFAVASALIIGYTDKIDADVKKAYSSTGAMHILSVSGLHVGIVFIVFNFMLFFLDKMKHGKIIKAVILILFLWAYAAITGLSAAVIRAAAMFSFVVIGKNLNRNVNILNTITASAVVILIVNPLFLADVGFQLSYLAVIGIVLFQSDIYKLLNVKNWLLDKVWALISVSLAAQIATLPITLYHFHQFPNYFLITNILVIPISTVVLYLGIAVFSFSFSDFFVHWLGKVLSITVKALNETIIYIEHLPYSITENILISSVEAILFFIVMVLISLFLYTKKIKYLQLSLASLVLVAVTNIVFTFTTLHQNQLIVYSTPGKSAVDFIHGNSDFLITDILSDDRKYQTIKHNWIHKGINEHFVIDINKLNPKIDKENIFIKNNFILFRGKRIAILNQEQALKKYQNQLSLDYIIYTGVKNKVANNMLSNFYTKNLIFNNLSDKKFVETTKLFTNKNIHFYNTLKNGWFAKSL